jgi:hypothetical protein
MFGFARKHPTIAQPGGEWEQAIPLSSAPALA